MNLRGRFAQALVAVHDLFASIAAYVFANMLAFGPNRFFLVPGIWDKAFAFVGICAVSFYLMRLNRAQWRYASLPDLMAIVKAAALAVAIFTLGNFLLSRAENVSRSATILMFVFLVFGLGAGRLIYRALKDQGLPRIRRRGQVKRIVLFPHSDTTESYIRAALRHRSMNVRIQGVIDARPHLKGSQIHGCAVLGDLDSIERVVEASRRKRKEITELVVSDPRTSGAELSALLDACARAGITMSRLPDLLDPTRMSSESLLATKPVRLEDLLGRPEIRLDAEGIAELIRHNTVLITGAGGSIGSELCRQISALQPSRLVLLEQSELNIFQIETELREKFPGVLIEPKLADVRDRDLVSSIFRATRPRVVFHAAALKHVPLVEENPIEGIKTNYLGTAIVADASIECGVELFIQVSTDKAVNPTGVMGATKRAAESYCQSLDLSGSQCRFQIVRFGNVLGSSGSIVPHFQRQIARGGPLTITDEQASRYFMTIPEAVTLMICAAARGVREEASRGRILVLNMGQPVKIVDLARRLVQLAGHRAEVDIKFEYIGLRSGEKLSEEYISEYEQVVEQDDDSYFVVSSPVANAEIMRRSISQMKMACTENNMVKAIEHLHNVVPTYKRRDPGLKEFG